MRSCPLSFALVTIHSFLLHSIPNFTLLINQMHISMKALQLGITLLLLCIFNGINFAQANISQGKRVTISSIDGNFSESAINDGISEFDNETQSSLTKTMGGQYQWIQFDLESKYEITKVVFHCPESVQKGLKQVIQNDDLFIAVSDDPNFKDVYDASAYANAEYYSCYKLNTSRLGMNTTPINRKLEGRYIRVWDGYINGITATEIEIFGKVSSSAAKEAIAAGDTDAALRLIENGGDVDSEKTLKLAIDKRDDQLIKAVLDKDRYVPSSVMVHAIQNNASKSVMTSLLSGDVEVNNTVVEAAIKSKNDDTVTKLLTKNQSAFTSSHVDLAFSFGQSDLGMKILKKTNIKPSRKVLEYAVNDGNMVMASELINTYQAKPDSRMLNTSLRSGNEPMINLLSLKVKPDSESFQIAASKDDYEMFQDLVAEGRLPDNKAIEIAIDKGNSSIVKKGLKNGGKVTPALEYAIQKKNKDMVNLIVDQKGADVNKAIDYAVGENDKELFSKIVNELKGDAEKALAAAIKSKKTNLAIIALETGETNPTQYLADAVKNANVELAKTIVDVGGDANKGMLPAVETNNLELVEYFISYEASTKEPKLIDVAARNKKMEIVKILVEKGADANNGIASASGAGRLDVVRYLLDNEADPDKGMSHAASAGNNEVLQVLIDTGGDPDKGIAASVNGNQTASVKLLLDSGANAKVPEYIAKASAKNNLEMVKSLVDNGADIENGLSSAVAYNAVSTLKYFVEQGGDLNDAEYMKLAVKEGAIGVIPVIAESGLDMNEKVYKEGYSYLHHSIALSNDSNLAHTLIQAGADVNTVDNANDTPLHYAARRGKNKGYLKVAEMLLNAGADINPRNNSGNTPRRVAKTNKMKNLLKKHGGVKK